MKTVYVAHSVTNGHQSFEEIRDMISWLEKKHYKVLQPSGFLFPDILASRALKSIEMADIVMADVTVYSHGVGFELGYAYSLKKQIIVISNSSAKDKVSKFLLGLFPQIIFYDDSESLINNVSLQLKSLQKNP